MDTDSYLAELTRLRDEAAAHDAAARAAREAAHELIRTTLKPDGVSKMDLHRASGISRTTIDSLLNTGRSW